jgi:membrane-associated phospholipid phosphatase
VTLLWSAGFFVAFAVIAWMVAQQDRSPLDSVDTWGRHAEDWADDHQHLLTFLSLVEHAFSTIGMTVLTVLLAGALLLNKHRRAALFTVLVMVTTSLITTVVKLNLARTRPDWQASADFLETKSFPSGHASSVTAFAAILAVLALMLVRRSSLRRWAYAGCVLFVVVVWADRVMLGRHYPTDVVGGSLLGLAVTLLLLGLVSPLPRGHAVHEEPLPEVFASQRRLAVILNPIKVEDVGAFRALVNTMATESGWSEPRWHYTTI